MGTDLRLLIDEAIQNDVAEDIVNSSSALNCEYVRDLTQLKSKSDVEVMDYATAHRRIVLTTETKFDDKSFKICTHHGIIVVTTRSTYRVAPTLKNFLLSGHRKEAENAVTFIDGNSIHIKKHGNVVVDYRM